MQQQLEDHFKRDRLFTGSQYGFRKGRSTITTVSSLAEDTQVAALKTKNYFQTDSDGLLMLLRTRTR